MLSSNISYARELISSLRPFLLLLHVPHNMLNFGPLADEIGPVVWGTPANFNGFRALAALRHGTPAVGVSETLRR